MSDIEWHTYAIEWDESGIRTWVDGKEIASEPYAPTPPVMKEDHTMYTEFTDGTRWFTTPVLCRCGRSECANPAPIQRVDS